MPQENEKMSSNRLDLAVRKALQDGHLSTELADEIFEAPGKYVSEAEARIVAELADAIRANKITTASKHDAESIFEMATASTFTLRSREAFERLKGIAGLPLNVA